MNYISSDAIIKNAENNLVLQNFNQDLQSKLGILTGTQQKPRNWFEEAEQEGYLFLPSLNNAVEMEDNLPETSQEVKMIAPKTIVERKNLKCPCQSLNTDQNYNCVCDKSVEKIESGKPIEPFVVNKKDGTITLNKNDLYKIIIVVLILIMMIFFYKLHSIEKKHLKLKSKYKKMKRRYDSSSDDD